MQAPARMVGLPKQGGHDQIPIIIKPLTGWARLQPPQALSCAEAAAGHASKPNLPGTPLTLRRAGILMTLTLSSTTLYLAPPGVQQDKWERAQSKHGGSWQFFND